MMNEKNILIAGGGTGGHLYPAVAIIEHIRDYYPGTSMTFIGSGRGSGRRLITAMGIEFHAVRGRGLAGGGSLLRKTAVYLMFLLELIPGFFKSLSIIRKKNIDAVLGMGGYICAPVLLAAIVSRTGFALHEQNYIPGRLNRLFSRRASYFFSSFRDTEKYLEKGRVNIIFSGNPVRKSIKNSAKLAPDYKKWGLAPGKFTITAFGGSQGAERINSSLLELTAMKDGENSIQVLLITGTRFYEHVAAAVRGMDPGGRIDIRVYPFIDDIEKVYRVTDLVIARAGANTIFETAAAGIPSILIPYPFAIDDHQTYNARYMQKQGRSILIEEKDLKPGLLENKIKYLLKGERKVYNKMRDCCQDITNMDSSAIICNKLMEDVC